MPVEKRSQSCPACAVAASSGSPCPICDPLDAFPAIAAVGSSRLDALAMQPAQPRQVPTAGGDRYDRIRAAMARTRADGPGASPITDASGPRRNRTVRVLGGSLIALNLVILVTAAVLFVLRDSMPADVDVTTENVPNALSETTDSRTDRQPGEG